MCPRPKCLLAIDLMIDPVDTKTFFRPAVFFVLCQQLILLQLKITDWLKEKLNCTFKSKGKCKGKAANLV